MVEVGESLKDKGNLPGQVQGQFIGLFKSCLWMLGALQEHHQLPWGVRENLVRPLSLSPLGDNLNISLLYVGVHI